MNCGAYIHLESAWADMGYENENKKNYMGSHFLSGFGAVSDADGQRGGKDDP